MLNSTSSSMLCIFNYDTFKYEVKKTNNNNSISGYIHINNGAMWIPDMYYHILSFLDQLSRHNIWIANDSYIKQIKPDPNKYNYKPNISYIIWSLRQPHISYVNQITLFSSYKQKSIMCNAILKINRILCRRKLRKELLKKRLIEFIKNTDYTNQCKCVYCYNYNILKNFDHTGFDVFWLESIIPMGIIELDIFHRIELL